MTESTFKKYFFWGLLSLGIFVLADATFSDPEPINIKHDSRAAYAAATQKIKARMKSPAQTVFVAGSEYHYRRADGVFEVGGMVDAPNNFGVLLRRHWSMVLEPKNANTYTILSSSLSE